MSLCTQLDLGSGDLNSGLYIYVASALFIGSPPQPRKSFFIAMSLRSSTHPRVCVEEYRFLSFFIYSIVGLIL